MSAARRGRPRGPRKLKPEQRIRIVLQCFKGMVRLHPVSIAVTDNLPGKKALIHGRNESTLFLGFMLQEEGILDQALDEMRKTGYEVVEGKLNLPDLSEHSVKNLCRFVNHEDWKVRLVAVRELEKRIGQIEEKDEVINALAKASADNQYWEIRHVAVIGLVKLKDVRTVAVLARRVNDKNIQVQEICVNAIKRWLRIARKDESVRTQLESITSRELDIDKNPGPLAIELIGMKRDPKDIPILLKAFKSQNMQLKKSAGKALWGIAKAHPEHPAITEEMIPLIEALKLTYGNF